MKLLFSIPTGYHLRELVLPLRSLLERDATIERIFCISPGASHRDILFPAYSDKFQFITNPANEDGHRKLLAELMPNIVVTDTLGHDLLDFPILKAAHDVGIKTLTFIASWDNVWKIERMVNKGQPIVIPDHIIVWNVMMRNHLLHIFPHLPIDRISMIGAPRLDFFWSDEVPSKKNLYEFLGLANIERPLIQFATTELYPMDYVVRTMRHAIQSGRIKNNPYLYASVHPGGTMKNHELLRQYDVTIRYSFGRREQAPSPKFLYNPTEDEIRMLVSLFTHSDLLICQSSTVALESIIAGTPVINVMYGKSFDWWRWYRSMVYRDFQQHYKDLLQYGATFIARNPRSLLNSASNALTGKNTPQSAREKTIQTMITTTDGSARSKVLDCIIAHASR